MPLGENRMNIQRLVGAVLLPISVLGTVPACRSSVPAPIEGQTESSRRAAQFSGRPDLTSGLGIPARETFYFAGGQPREFIARATNTGQVAVTLLVELDEVVTEVGTLEPGSSGSWRFGPREAALFRNATDREASLKVEVRGDTGVAMYYEPTEG